MYAEETAQDAPPQRLHPLARAFDETIRLERRRHHKMNVTAGGSNRRYRLPVWLRSYAMRWMQFVDAQGAIYFYDFATGETASEITEILHKCNASTAALPRPPCEDKSAPWAIVTGAAQGIVEGIVDEREMAALIDTAQATASEGCSSTSNGAHQCWAHPSQRHPGR